MGTQSSMGEWPSRLEDRLETFAEELLVHGLADEHDLGHPLLALRPRSSIVLIADIHDGVENVLEGVVLDGEDRFNPEDGPVLGLQLPQHLHPSAELLRRDLAIPHDGERVDAVVVAVLALGAAVPVASARDGAAVAGAMCVAAVAPGVPVAAAVAAA
eukprot:CAMPEP_0177476060 /NCGR_PEP_ID=MMETSP0369-20130122/23372_1 /TAXON_ID=447022 ORGANISM="Scrippsiella hangoei-like, Strain SHHI-4" /NCGR_SAMPLE_ID=MMETSP0369 /ASSEMBLY_ACC=CAM_ASM_000364 /LENGTH=157 /DNA_ID=CAMNT_0018951239 /DNA_START=73 /DNA_END=542 /DNA_ORIENTATION=+